MIAERPAYGTAMIRCSKRKCTFKGYETDLVTRVVVGSATSKQLCPECRCDSYYFMTEKESSAHKEAQRQAAGVNINTPIPYTQSEAPIVSEGRQARADGQPITANPYPQVCQTSIREHWLWHYGWQRGETA
jgi:hypothetical protein